MEKYLVSVIVPVYNVEAYIKKCVESIKKQSYQNLEIILVNDGSSDNSGKLCDDFALDDSRIVVIHKENGGLSDARNFGLDIAKGDYFLFVDSDDFIESEMVEELLTACVDNEVKISCGGRYNIDEHDNRKRGLCYKKDEKIQSKQLFSKMLITDECDFATWPNLYHKSCFEKIRFPVGKLYEDMATTYKVILKEEYVYICSKHLYNYLCRTDSITQSKYTVKQLDRVDNAKEIYDFVKLKHVDLIPQARCLYVKALEGVLSMIDKGTKEERRANKKTYDRLVAELKSQMKFWIKNEFITFPRKIRYFLFILNVQYIFNRIKRK